MEIYERLGVDYPATTADRIVLTHEQRERGRLRAATDSGREAKIFLKRGAPLQVGEVLRSQCGTLLRVDGALERVAVARCDDWERFARACYHLGNRHVKVEVGARSVSIVADHVLEEMLSRLGLEVTHEQRVFRPESGAYSHGHHHH